MYCKKFKIAIILFLLFCGSCTTTNCLQKRVPKQLRYIENELRTDLGDRCYSIRPLIRKENDIGIYSYGIKGHYLLYTFIDVFMFDGDTVIYTRLYDSLNIKTFIDSNSFSEQKIRKFNKRVKILNNKIKSSNIW